MRGNRCRGVRAADPGARPGVLEYLPGLKLAAEKTVERVGPVLRAQLALAGKGRALQGRAHLAPAAGKGSALAELTPSLGSHDTLWESEGAQAGGESGAAAAASFV